MHRSIFIGFDPREAGPFAVARASARRLMTVQIPVNGLVLSDLQQDGLYTRPLEYRQSAADRPQMWDPISDAPMSTEHAISRFLVPHLAGTGWALFMDGDVLVRGNLVRLFDRLMDDKALYCVQHHYEPLQAVKMDGQQQTRYARKNWSSVMAFNCDHPANRSLTPALINSLPGRELHRFCWLDDAEIGALDPEWNWLAGVSAPIDDPKVVHFTLGCPDMPGYASAPFADEWRVELARWAHAG